VRGNGDVSPGLDHECVSDDNLDPAVVAFFENLDHANGDSLIAFGWAMAEDLAVRGRK
jgi:hypothetical protein